MNQKYNPVVIYASIHGHSKKVAHSFLKFPVYSVREKINLKSYDTFIFICPTYGDEEVCYAMEDFLINLNEPKRFAVCELGNYYGYDDFSFGAKKIIINYLKSKNWIEFSNHLSLDSMPQINWEVFNRWKSKIEANV